MAFVVEVDIETEFSAACMPQFAFEVLADVPFSVSHFPKVDKLTDLGDGKYRWEMEKIGIDRYAIQTIYASKYTSDPDKLTVKWTPVKGEGNAQVSGKWTLKEKKGETVLKLTTHGEMELPLPSLVKFAVAPIVRSQFESMVEEYAQNLVKTLESGKKPKAKAKAAAKKK